MSPYRVIDYDSGPERGDEAVKNEWADKGYRLDQVARRSTYEWPLIFLKRVHFRQRQVS